MERRDEKKKYEKPQIESEKVLEKAALACAGFFSNTLTNIKDNSSQCGFNDS